MVVNISKPSQSAEMLMFAGDLTVRAGITRATITGIPGSAILQFTLTCISTGGPATTVTWTRDSTTVITEGTQTVLNDPATAQYTHTLTLAGTLEGLCTCTVANNKPSSHSFTFSFNSMYGLCISHCAVLYYIHRAYGHDALLLYATYHFTDTI